MAAGLHHAPGNKGAHGCINNGDHANKGVTDAAAPVTEGILRAFSTSFNFTSATIVNT